MKLHGSIKRAALALCLAATTCVGLSWAFTLLTEKWFQPLDAKPELLWTILAVPALAIVFVFLGVLWALRTLRKTPRGTTGAARLGVLALGSALLGLAAAVLLGVLGIAAHASIGKILGGTIESMLFAATNLGDSNYSSEAFEGALDAGRIGLIATSALVLGSIVSCWFLIEERTRQKISWAFDALLFIAFAIATAKFSLTPAEGDPHALAQAVSRVALSGLLAIRLGVRSISPALSALEQVGFRLFIAARHLRAKKSGFLAANGMLSILAIAIASCMLVTVLSVMGGFRDDLKRKILGNHAHIVVDTTKDGIKAWQPVLDKASSVKGAVAATPYVQGEVMLSSVANKSAAVLRGVDPNTVGDVTDLKKNLTHGKLDYLSDPAKLLEHNSKTSTKLPLDIDIKGEGISRTFDGDTGGDTGHRSPVTGHRSPDPAPVLPGIVLGQELARMLRLVVGDRVTVISPRGMLGPTGPIPKARAFRVTAIFYSGMYEYDMKFVYTELQTAQRFLNRRGTVSGVEVKVEEVDDAMDIADELRGAFAGQGLRVQDWRALNQHLFGALALEKLAMFITLGIAILVAGFSVFGTLTLLVREKTREVGVLKAMGLDKRIVVQIFLWEGLLIGLAGAALGLGLGFLASFGARHFGIRLNSEVYYIDRLPVQVDPSEFALVGVCTVVICLLATVIPAVQASRVHPVNALKLE